MDFSPAHPASQHTFTRIVVGPQDGYMSVVYDISWCGPGFDSSHPFSSHSTNMCDEFVLGMAYSVMAGQSYAMLASDSGMATG